MKPLDSHKAEERICELHKCVHACVCVCVCVCRQKCICIWREYVHEPHDGMKSERYDLQEQLDKTVRQLTGIDF